VDENKFKYIISGFFSEFRHKLLAILMLFIEYRKVKSSKAKRTGEEEEIN